VNTYCFVAIHTVGVSASLENTRRMMSTVLNPPLSTPLFDVTGRVFVITGGTQGLGLEIARQLKASGAAGLVLVSRSQDRGNDAVQELHDTNCVCVYICADMSDSEAVEQIIPTSIQKMSEVGPISGVVNAAATTNRGNLFTTSAGDFDTQMAINVRAPFLITQSAANHMIESNVRGSIVNICSVAGHGGAPFIMAYCASKAALINLTKNNAAELAPHGIRVNGINMGWCLTENEDRLQTDLNGGDKNWWRQADAQVPLGRIIRPIDVASSVGFLLSNSSAMMTGSFIELHPEYQKGMQSLRSFDERL